MMEPPAIIRLIFCLTCGRDDRWRHLSQTHYIGAQRCEYPNLVTLDYLLPISLGGLYPDKEKR